jgi:hypothetical protein
MSREPHAEPAIPGPDDSETESSSLDSPKAEMEGLNKRRATEVTYAPPNLRRSNIALRYFLITLALLLILTAAIVGLYLTQILPALASPVAQATPQKVPVARAIEVNLPSSTLDQIATSAKQIQELQKQIDATRALQDTQAQQLEKLIERVASTRSDEPPPMATTDSAGITSDPSSSTPFLPTSSAATAELRLLKERNRLTTYADESIATGLRRPLNLIIDAMRDPDRANLFHAAQAEYYRIMGHFQLLNRIEPTYKLPLSELFPQKTPASEANLTIEQLISLLENKELAWQVRLRSAFLLGGRRTPEVNAALVKAFTDDPSLDVAKEAQLSFEQNVGHKFLLFDFAGLSKWWQTQLAVRTDSGSTPSGN